MKQAKIETRIGQIKICWKNQATYHILPQQFHDLWLIHLEDMQLNNHFQKR